MASSQAVSRILLSDLLHPAPAQSPWHPPATKATQATPPGVNMDLSFSRVDGEHSCLSTHHGIGDSLRWCRRHRALVIPQHKSGPCLHSVTSFKARDSDRLSTPSQVTETLSMGLDYAPACVCTLRHRYIYSHSYVCKSGVHKTYTYRDACSCVHR